MQIKRPPGRQLLEEKCAHLVDSLGDFLGMKAQNWGENEGEKRVSKYTVNKLVEFHVHSKPFVEVMNY